MVFVLAKSQQIFSNEIFSIISDLCVEAEFLAQVPNEIVRSAFSWAWPLTEPMCSVYSAVSGQALAVVDDYEGKTAKEVKRFWQLRLVSPDFGRGCGLMIGLTKFKMMRCLPQI